VTVSALHKHLVFGRRVRILAEHLDPLIPANASVLDIGCGDGALAALVMRRRPDLRITGVDVLVRPGARIPVERFDGSHLPFEDASFDVAMLIDVLHHTDDPNVLLREGQRVVRRALLLKDHTLRGVAARPTLSIMDWVGNAHHGVRLPYNYWTPAQWREAFVRLNFDVARWEASLHLYPRPFSWLFDRELHFIAALSTTATPSVARPNPQGDRDFESR
jgi:SAM-dependent methyltransferase